MGFGDEHLDAYRSVIDYEGWACQRTIPIPTPTPTPNKGWAYHGRTPASDPEIGPQCGGTDSLNGR
jgi:hypothetical protein